MGMPVKGSMSFSIYIDCPKCDEQFDVIDSRDNEEGDWTNAFCDWISNKPKADKPNMDTHCPDCKTEVTVTDLEY